MQKLGKREEQIMQVVWKQKESFIKDIIGGLPEPRPHYNTVATIVKILVEKGFLRAEKIGNTHRYSAVIQLENYREQDMAIIRKKYFGNSFSKMISHFAKEENLSNEELDELVRIIKSQKNK